MELNDYITWANIPEYILENNWSVEIFGGSNPNPIPTDYFSEVLLDNSISEITFPQEELSFKKTSFGLPIIEELSEYDGVTITYYDYANSPLGKMPITRFFQAWMDSIYDKDNLCIKNDWRKHFKTLHVNLTRYLKKSYLGSIANDISSQALNFTNRVVKATTDIDTNWSTNFDIQEVKSCTYEIETCYPSKLSELNLTNSDGDRLGFSVDLICERVIPHYN